MATKVKKGRKGDSGKEPKLTEHVEYIDIIHSYMLLYWLSVLVHLKKEGQPSEGVSIQLFVGLQFSKWK